jgi:choline transport protein
MFADKKVGLAYAILNSWVAMATSLSIALPSGGPTAILYGLIVSFLGNLAMSASLAEM